eukprot:gnl/MRDRNA2_/MRDRNA2_60284_c0_seq1.p1 gnl/MRDRNA2_/MRDRNA2_60284_c0~~gnl/MRDRNA2_/MRDRNA2_60284_c0_seq1.p1  ORF type:complete len:246 (+),score=60.17 gnl/MRDRNA2_/MRDRNA2_60284_c0_seq1:396-1133(+)
MKAETRLKGKSSESLVGDSPVNIDFKDIAPPVPKFHLSMRDALAKLHVILDGKEAGERRMRGWRLLGAQKTIRKFLKKRRQLLAERAKDEARAIELFTDKNVLELGCTPDEWAYGTEPGDPPKEWDHGEEHSGDSNLKKETADKSWNQSLPEVPSSSSSSGEHYSADGAGFARDEVPPFGSLPEVPNSANSAGQSLTPVGMFSIDDYAPPTIYGVQEQEENADHDTNPDDQGSRIASQKRQQVSL